MKTKGLLVCLLIGCGLFTGASVWAEPLRIVLPAETASFRGAPGVELAMAQCVQCHSAEYITTQPPLGREAWKASLQKMRGKYGAVVPPESEAALLDYLVGAYGPASSVSPLQK
jgi:mono/diheme cytochrome c family protein